MTRKMKEKDENKASQIEQSKESPAFPCEDNHGFNKREWAIFQIALHRNDFSARGLEIAKCSADNYFQALVD